MTTPKPAKAKAKPAKTKALPAKTKTAPAPKPAPEPKPEPVKTILTVDGVEFEMKEGTDIKAIEASAKDVSEAAEKIAKKDSDLLSSYLAFGGFASGVAPQFKSTKLYGQYLAKAIPAAAALEAGLRSNCKWLYEALNLKDAEGSDLLTVLGVNRIEDYKSGNPTVIKRAYKDAIKKAETLDKAKAKGIDTENEDEAVKAVSDAEKAAQEKAMKTQITKAVNNLIKFAGGQENKDDALAEVGDLLKEMFKEHKGLAKQVEFLSDLS